VSRPRPPSDEALTVSQVNQLIGRVLKDGFPDPFWVAGEVQGYARDVAKGAQRQWGQVYFEIVEKEPGKDSARASIKTLVWGDAHASIQRKLAEASDKLALQDGVQVKFLCAVDFWWPRASLQLKVLDVDPEFTLGGLERARQELVKALQEKGLYDRNRAVPLPPVPLTVGLITSEGSAAYHDFTDELRRSGYAFRVLLWDARMQGEDTESGVCRGLAALEASPEVDVIALVRGGGSRSDLIWFDKEKIAYAVAECGKPVVTGIGHEIDLSVADLVAHESRKTPTAAAQFLVETVAAFDRNVTDAGRQVMEHATGLLAEARRSLREAVAGWRGASSLLLERHGADLTEARAAVGQGARRHLALAKERLLAAPPRMRRAAADRFRAQRERLAGFAKECALKDPSRLLERGYSLLFTDGGRLLKSVEDAAEGSDVKAQLKDGFLTAKVVSKRRATT
jgi:exodeoxyribonuclease VII large subunit